MQRKLTTLALVSFVALGSACATPTVSGSVQAVSEDGPATVVASPTPTEILSSLGWLEGNWLGEVDGRLWETIYGSPDGGQILSMSKEIVDGKLVFFEFERFSTSATDVLLWPYPAGRNSVSFRLVEHDAGRQRAVFENLAHDFPKRIVYERTGDLLEIDVTGERRGEPSGFTLLLIPR